MKEVLKRNGSESTERECAKEKVCTTERTRESENNRKWRSESKPLGEEASAEFQVLLMALLSHLDLHCSCLGIAQGPPDIVQGCNSLWNWKIKSKDKSNVKFNLLVFYFICSHSGADENTVVSTVGGISTNVWLFFTAALKVGGICS